jgi:hypothetical protein
MTAQTNSTTKLAKLALLDFNSVIVIQSLPDNETQTGRNLYNDIIKRMCEQKQLVHLFSDVRNKDEFRKSMSEIHRLCHEKRIFPLIHFEIHGGKTGFQLKDGMMISWHEVVDLCRNINVAIQNQLIVSLATCMGAYISTGLDINKATPYWGFIGPKHKISEGDIVEDFGELFSELLSSYDIDKALEVLRTKQRRHEYAYLPVQLIFEELVEKEIKKHPFNKIQKFKDLMSKSKQKLPHLNRSQRRKELRRLINNFDRNAFVDRVKHEFLMGRIIE